MTINRLNAVVSPATFMRLNAKVLTHAEVQRGSLLTQLLIPGHFPSTSAPLHTSHGSPAGLSFTLIPLTTELCQKYTIKGKKNANAPPWQGP